MGLGSGEYGGRKKSLAPAPRMACLTAVLLCEQNHYIARFQGRHLRLLHPGNESLAIDPALEDIRGGNPVMSEGRIEGHCQPMARREPWRAEAAPCSSSHELVSYWSWPRSHL